MFQVYNKCPEQAPKYIYIYIHDNKNFLLIITQYKLLLCIFTSRTLHVYTCTLRTRTSDVCGATSSHDFSLHCV